MVIERASMEIEDLAMAITEATATDAIQEQTGQEEIEEKEEIITEEITLVWVDVLTEGNVSK